MIALSELDQLNAKLAECLFYAPPMSGWRKTIATFSFTPDGSVGQRRYHFYLEGGEIDKGSSPLPEPSKKLGQLTVKHWRLTQDLGLPRWFRMIVTVERSGKFNIEFEYKDDYKEGDIMRSE